MVRVLPCQRQHFNDNKQIGSFRSKQDNIEWTSQVPYTDPNPTRRQSVTSTSKAPGSLHDMGSSRWDEIKVVQTKLVDPPNRLCSFVDGLVVYDVETRDQTPIVVILSAINLPHSMHGRPGFTRLIGIITDATESTSKSILSSSQTHTDVSHEWPELHPSRGGVPTYGPCKSYKVSAGSMLMDLWLRISDVNDSRHR